MENTEEKVCVNCGEKLLSGSCFCIKCGTQVEGEAVKKPVNLSGVYKKNRKRNSVLILAGVILAIIFFLYVNPVLNLKKELKRGWLKLEGEDDVYINCILDFSDDEIEYRL